MISSVFPLLFNTAKNHAQLSKYKQQVHIVLLQVHVLQWKSVPIAVARNIIFMWQSLLLDPVIITFM
jgi:hypothetical protein